MSFLLGWPFFRCYVSFREGICSILFSNLLGQWANWILHPQRMFIWCGIWRFSCQGRIRFWRLGIQTWLSEKLSENWRGTYRNHLIEKGKSSSNKPPLLGSMLVFQGLIWASRAKPFSAKRKEKAMTWWVTGFAKSRWTSEVVPTFWPWKPQTDRRNARFRFSF